jgi:hypothetical protein
MAKVQVLKVTPVNGVSAKGPYSFYRLACVFIDDKNQPEAVGDLIHDQLIEPGVYPVSFSAGSYQGKLSAKIVLQIPPK